MKLKFKPLSGMKSDIKSIQIPKAKTRTKTIINVLIFIAIFTIYLFSCDAFISYLFNLLNI